MLRKPNPSLKIRNAAILTPIFGALMISACDKSSETKTSASGSGAEPKAVSNEEATTPRVGEAKAVFGKIFLTLETMTGAFESVTDEASAKAAAEVISSKTSEMIALSEKANALREELSGTENAELEKNNAKFDLPSLRERLAKAGAAMPKDPEIRRTLGPAIKSFGEAMRTVAVKSGNNVISDPDAEERDK